MKKKWKRPRKSPVKKKRMTKEKNIQSLFISFIHKDKPVSHICICQLNSAFKLNTFWPNTLQHVVKFCLCFGYRSDPPCSTQPTIFTQRVSSKKHWVCEEVNIILKTTLNNSGQVGLLNSLRIRHCCFALNTSRFIFST